MDTIYGLVPAMILLALVSVAVFFWASRSGQYDDMEGPAHRILNDDDDPLLPKEMKQQKTDASQDEDPSNNPSNNQDK